MQFDLFAEKPSWEPPRMADLPDLRGAKVLGVDTETKDPLLKTHGPGFIRGDAHVLGVSIAVDKVNAFYLPFRHWGNNMEEQEGAWRWVKDAVGSAETVLFANAHYDMDALKTEGIEIASRVYDVQVVDALIDENLNSYSLENIGQRRLGEGKLSLELSNTLKMLGLTMSDLDKVESEYVAEYAIKDASLLVDIWLDQQSDIVRENLQNAIKVETELTSVLWRMHQRGVDVDLDYVQRLDEEWAADGDLFKKEAQRIAGWSFNLTSPKHLAAVLRSENIEPAKTATGKDSVTNELLELHSSVPLANNILQFRRMEKMRRDYVDGVFSKYYHNGKIYPQWFQSRNTKVGSEDVTGANTGRITGSKPNLTQIPVRTAEAKRVRKAVTKEGKLYCKLDYSSQEPRIALHFAAVANLDMAERDVKRYEEDKHTDFHQMTKDMVADSTGVNIDRFSAKTINLGIMYDMQLNSLSTRLKVDPEVGKRMLDAHKSSMPYISELADKAKEKAMTEHVIRTINGRHVHYNMWESGRWGENKTYRSREKCLEEYGNAVRAGTRKALNAAVQGSAADQMKNSLIALDREGLEPVLQVYDEVGCFVESNEEALLYAEIMENSTPLRVPSLVEPSIGNSWGDCA